MAGENIRFLCFIRFKRPISEIVCAAKNDSIGAREHVEAIEDCCVLHFGLRQKECKLAANGLQFFVVKEVAGAEPSAIEDELL
jgi:hypothetical protein